MSIWGELCFIGRSCGWQNCKDDSQQQQGADNKKQGIFSHGDSPFKLLRHHWTVGDDIVKKIDQQKCGCCDVLNDDENIKLGRNPCQWCH